MAIRNYMNLSAKLKETGYTIGCYDNRINRLSIKEFDKVLSVSSEEHTDVSVTYRGKKYIVEVYTVDREKDFAIKSYEEYAFVYGREYEE